MNGYSMRAKLWQTLLNNLGVFARLLQKILNNLPSFTKLWQKILSSLQRGYVAAAGSSIGIVLWHY
jgi:hypothetical protein